MSFHSASDVNMWHPSFLLLHGGTMLTRTTSSLVWQVLQQRACVRVITLLRVALILGFQVFHVQRVALQQTTLNWTITTVSDSAVTHPRVYTFSFTSSVLLLTSSAGLFKEKDIRNTVGSSPARNHISDYMWDKLDVRWTNLCANLLFLCLWSCKCHSFTLRKSSCNHTSVPLCVWPSMLPAFPWWWRCTTTTTTPTTKRNTWYMPPGLWGETGTWF